MTRPLVLVFCGADPSGGAGMTADIQAITACGAHPLPVVTCITVQDNARVYAIHPLAASLVTAQASAMMDCSRIAAIKIGIVGSRKNSLAIAALIDRLRADQADLPVVLDPVLASGHGDALSTDDPLQAMEPLLARSTLLTPNAPEAELLCGRHADWREQAAGLLGRGCANVLLKGGHGDDPAIVTNHWVCANAARVWHWPRLAWSFHGSGCTLASAITAYLAQGATMERAIGLAQIYCQSALAAAFEIAAGQRIPQRAICAPQLYP